ncbi:MAG: hypothetical protein R2761_13180 [Acidimicrobiales bacterium]
MTGCGRRRAARAVALAAGLVSVIAFALLPALVGSRAAAAQDGTQPPASVPADPAATTVVPPDPGTTVVPPDPGTTVAPAPAQPGTATSAGPTGAVAPGEVAGADLAAPDLLVMVGAGVDPAPVVEALVAALSGAPGVSWVAGDATVQPPQVLVGLEPGAPGEGIDEVRRAVAAQSAAAPLTLAGRALADDAAASRARTGAIVAAVLAMALVGGLMAWLRGRNEAVLAVAGIGATALLGGALSAGVAGPFDGSVATTPLPGVLAALLMASYLLFRLVGWFTTPEGDDHPAMVQAVWRAVGPEVGLSLAALAAAALLTELVSPARSMATLVLVGAGVAAVVLLAVTPPVLALLGHPGVAPASSDESDPGDVLTVDGTEATGPVEQPDHQPPRPLWLTPVGPALPGPDGRQLPVAVLMAAGVVLAILAVFSFRSTSADALFDERATGTELDPTVLTTSGDPTAAIVARFGPGVDQLAKTAWLERISLVPGVARVETATSRYVAGARVDVPTVPLAAAGVDRGDEAPTLALVVPTTSSRSPAARQLVGDVRQMGGTVAVTLSGAPVDARTAAGRDASSTWALIIFLALASSAAAFALVRDTRLAAASGGLHLLGSAATAGFYQILATRPTGGEVQLAVLLGALATLLFELGVLHRLARGPHTAATDELLDDALRAEGWPALAALAVTSVAGLGLLAADLTVVRRLAVVLVVTATVEALAGMWLLRPPVMGDRALRFVAVHPVQAALRVVRGPATAEDPQWTGVVTELLAAEQALQTDPAGGDLDRVFVPGTPLHRKATDHHAHLADAGLRVMGRDPQLRMVRVVGTTPTVTLTVTVDHPPRQLVDATGAVLGVRKPERRSVMLWLKPEPDGSHRIADSVELGVEPLGAVEPSPAPPPAAVPSLMIDPAAR